jgi:hypothetical protein
MRLPAYRHEQTGSPALDRIQANIRALYDYLKAPRFGGQVEVDGDLSVDGSAGADGPVNQFVSASGGWADMIGRAISRTTGATVATFEQIAATVFWANKFDVGDQMWFELHIPHDYVPGTDVHFHAHWVADGTNANSVKWQFDWCTAAGYGRGEFAFASPTTDTAETTPGTQYRHYISETDAQVSAAFETDGLIMVRVTRITNGGTNNTDNIFVLFVDAHYKSSGAVTANRNYPFR